MADQRQQWAAKKNKELEEKAKGLSKRYIEDRISSNKWVEDKYSGLAEKYPDKYISGDGRTHRNELRGKSAVAKKKKEDAMNLQSAKRAVNRKKMAAGGKVTCRGMGAATKGGQYRGS